MTAMPYHRPGMDAFTIDSTQVCNLSNRLPDDEESRACYRALSPSVNRSAMAVKPLMTTRSRWLLPWLKATPSTLHRPPSV